LRKRRVDRAMAIIIQGRTVGVAEVERRIHELKSAAATEEKELVRATEALTDIAIRGIQKFADKASIHRARIAEIQIAIDLCRDLLKQS
jgi:hypothetical protein